MENLDENQQQTAGKPDGGGDKNQYENLHAFAAAEQEYLPGPGNGGPSDDGQQFGGKEIGNLYRMVFTMLAKRRGPHWMLSSDESDGLGEATAACLEKWFGSMEIGPEATLLVVGGMIMMPRMIVDDQIAEERARRAAQEAAAGDRMGDPPVADKPVKPAPRKPAAKRPAARKKPVGKGGAHGGQS